MSEQGREKIAYETDLDGVVRLRSGTTVTEGNVAKFGPGGTVEDSGKPASSLITSSELVSAVAAAIASAADGILSAVHSVEAFRAYLSPAWVSGTSYPVGILCMHDGKGYRCKEANSSATFVPAEWDEVLTASGKAAIDEIMGECSNAGMAALLDIAPAYSSRDYVKHQMVVKDGKLKVCTAPGFAETATFANGTVEESVAGRLADLMPNIQKGIEAWGRDYITVVNGVVSAIHGETSISLAKGSDLDGKADGTTIDNEYSQSLSYEIGDTCVHNGKWYKCSVAVPSGTEFNPSSWTQITVKEAMGEVASQVNADWNEQDPSNPAYIKNKPDVLSPYLVEELSAVNQGDPAFTQNTVTYRLKDRTVNIIRPMVGVSEDIRLIPPESLSGSHARDFLVVIFARSKVDGDFPDDDGSSSGSDSSDPADDYRTGDYVEVGFDASIECYDSRFNIDMLTAVIGKWVSYRFVETGLGNQNVFLVTGFSDPAYQKVLELDRALDAILMDGGAGGDFDIGVYIPGDDGLLHKIMAVTDDETGNVDVGVTKEGVRR